MKPRNPRGHNRGSVVTEAAARNPLATMPQEFFAVLEEAAAGRVPSSLVYVDKRMAIARRHALNRLKPYLISQGLPGAASLNAFVIRVEENEQGQGVVSFAGIPLPAIEAAAESLVVASPGKRFIEEQREDPLDRLLSEASNQQEKNNLGDFDKMICEHEWDTTEAFCLKCRAPKG